jgi:hypothetical protein
MSTPSLRDQIAEFFDGFVKAFGSFNGARVGDLYHAPNIALRGDGTIECVTSAADVGRFFQTTLDHYYAEGCRSCRFDELGVMPLGELSVLGTVTWSLLGDDGAVFRTWRQSYNLVRVDGGWRVLASTVHLGPQ